MTLSPKLYNELRTELTPYFSTRDQREVILSPLQTVLSIYPRIEWEGDGSVFTTRLLNLLRDKIEEMIQLVEEVATYVGEDIQARLAELITQIKIDGAAPPPYALTDATNVQPEQRPRRQWGRIILRWVLIVLAVIGIGVAVAWWWSSRSFEPFTVLIASVFTLVSALQYAETAPIPVLSDRPRLGMGRKPNLRQALIQRVQASWIEGFLYPSLRDVAALKIGMAGRPEAVIRHKQIDFPDADTGNIWGVYQAFDGRFLILGAPGAGKTILLLQLAEVINKAAATDSRQPPAAVFNLASWAREQKPLRDWLLYEFRKFYKLDARAANELLNNPLVLMLDGLDEVKLEARDACVDAINAFSAAHSGIRVMVCSRIADYADLQSKLDLKGALCIEALSAEQVNAYLAVHPKLEGLRAVLPNDPILQRMTTTPFLLNTIVYTYGGLPPEAIAGYPDEFERRQHLFDRYIERRYLENPSKRYSYAYTLKTLKWLASKMLVYTETVFTPGDIDGRWLDGADRQLWVFRMLQRGNEWLYTRAFTRIMNDGNKDGRQHGIFWSPNYWQTMNRMTHLERWLYRHIEQIRDLSAPVWLWWGGALPRRFIPFLESAVQHRIMRPLSGGFVFMHRSLLESLAGLDEINGLIRQLDDERLQGEATKGLVLAGEAAVKPLISVLGDSHENVRSRVAYILGEIGDEHAVEPLIVALADRESEVHFNAAHALGKIRNVQAIESLIAAMMIANIEDVSDIAGILGEIGEPAVLPLIAALANSNTFMRFGAAKALGKIGDVQAIEPLIILLGDSDKFVRQSAAEALAKMGVEQGFTYLIAALGDGDSDMRSIAAHALGKIGDKRAVEPLIAALGDSDRNVSYNATAVLEKFDTPEARAALKEYYRRLRNG